MPRRSVVVAFALSGSLAVYSAEARADDARPDDLEPSAAPAAAPEPLPAPPSADPAAAEPVPERGRGGDDLPRHRAKRARVLFIEPTLGIGTPVGLAGGSLVWAPDKLIALAAGAGAGLGGLQVAAGVRGRASATERLAFSFGAGWSMGGVTLEERGLFFGIFSAMGHSSARPPEYRWDRAQMLDFDIALEHDAGDLVLRPFLGLGYVLNRADAASGTPCPSGCAATSVRAFPYLGMSFAYGIL
ncbi:MAG: hypothetical protein KF764_27295 [Labilithrix sp.]|nr:hypothetical protein [Labilithrix sp.]